MQVVDETEADIARLMDTDRDFGPARSGDLHDDFYAWLHHLARRVPQLPRRVLISPEVQQNRAQYAAIDRIGAALTAGHDVGPWLSERTRRNPADHRADLMFNDWQILHFHLGNLFRSPTTVQRSGPLLYAHVSAEEVTFLDVQPHAQWARLDLLLILLRTNPPAMQRYEGRGITGQRMTDEQYMNARLNGYNVALEVDGRAFMAGMGRMSSGHALRLKLYGDWFWRAAADLKHRLEANQVTEPWRPLVYSNIALPVRLGAVYSPHGLSIIDKNRAGLQLYAMKPLDSGV